MDAGGGIRRSVLYLIPGRDVRFLESLPAFRNSIRNPRAIVRQKVDFVKEITTRS